MSERRQRSKQKAHQTISCFYPKQFSLLCYLRTVDNSLRLRDKDDTLEYQRLLSSTRVAIPRNQAVTLSQKPRHTQWCTTNEIIHRVIETACNSKSGLTNVLALGYERLRGNNKCGMVAGTSGIQNSYPNTIVSYIKTTEPWQTLHSRIGDDLMIHLFQNLALFVKMPSRCYLQISGHPIGLLSPLGTDSTCRVKSTSAARTSTLLTSTDGTRHLKSTSGRHGVDSKCNKSPNLSEKVAGSLSSRGDIMPTESSAANASMTGQNPVGSASTRRKKRRRGGKSWKASSRKTDNTHVLQETSRCETGITTSALSEAPRMSTKDQNCSGYVTPQNDSLSNKETSPEITGVCERSSERLADAEPSEETTAAFKGGRKRKAKDRSDDEDERREDKLCSKRRKMSKAEDIGTHGVLPGPLDSASSGRNEEPPISVCRKRKHDSIRKAGKQAQKTLQMAKQHRFCLRAVSRFLRRRRLSNKITRKRARIISKNRKVKAAKTRRTVAVPARDIQSKPTEKKVVKEARPNQMYIPRPRMFFASNLCQKLPKKHILEVTPVSQRGARKLIRAIFLETPDTKEKKTGKVSTRSSGNNEPSVTPKEKDATFKGSGTGGTKVSASRKAKPRRLPNRLHSLQSIFVRFLARHRSCPFRLLLRCHCPYERASLAGAKNRKSGKKNKKLEERKSTSSSSAATRKKENDQQQSCSTGSIEKLVYRQAVKSYTPYHKVLQFMKSVCRKVVPKELWGSPQNEAAFLKNLKGFLQLRQHEKFSMSQMTQGIKVSACAWLRSKKTVGRHVSVSESLTQKVYLIKFIWWLVGEYFMIILKSFFYITDSGLRRNHIFYYRKPVWRKIHEFGLKSLEGKVLQPLTKQAATSMLSRKEALGYSLLRFVPKATSIRPIVNMRHRQINKSGKAVSINMKLQNLFEVMKFERERNVARVGSSVLGVDDVYRALKPFAIKRRSNSDVTPLHFVRVDISGCYDSIVQQKLYDIMDNALEEEEYLLRRFTVLTLQDKSAHRTFNKHVSESCDCQTFPEFLRNLISETNLRDAVVTDSVWYLTEDRENLLQLLGEHILSNIVKIGERYYHQTQGIAQGSILSSLLSNFFYGAMETQYFPDVLGDPNSLLLRWVDDFLLVTPSRPLADKFLTSMHDGISEFGCFINSAKTLTNYEAVTPGGVAVKRIGSEDEFPWCGYLLHPATLEVQKDYSRYSEPGPIRDTITAELNVHPGHALRKKLMYSLRTKLHPLLLDPDINSPETVVSNVYQIFVLTAAKLHAFVVKMPKGHQAKDNPAFFAQTILDLARFFHSQASRRCRQLSRDQDFFQLSEGEVTWLCCQAFVSSLKRKQSRYVKLLDFLRGFIKRLRSVPSKGLVCLANDLSHKFV